jgi:hypothetical protein
VRQFGLTSLLVYWVHVELVYGRWFGSFKNQLNLGWTLLATAVTIGLMLLLSLIRTNRAAIRAYLGSGSAIPERVSGD